MKLSYFSEWIVLFAASAEAGIFVKFNECKTKGANECAQSRHEQVDAMPDGQDDDHDQDAKHGDAAAHFNGQAVEYKAHDGTGDAQGKKPDVGKQVPKDARNHVVAVPESDAYIHKHVAA